MYQIIKPLFLKFQIFCHATIDLVLTLVSKELFQFLQFKTQSLTFVDKLNLAVRCIRISFFVESPHSNKEIFCIFRKSLSVPKSLDWVFVETGVFVGGSAAKLSLLADKLKKDIHLFDSFKGIPRNTELHKYIHDDSDKISTFSAGSYKGTLSVVKRNIIKYGSIERCKFHKGFFKHTTKSFKAKVGVVFVDVDLVESTKDVIQNLYKRIISGGYYFSHDGHLKFVVNLYSDTEYWKNVIKAKKPRINGLGTTKLIFFRKN